jgi:hypothetical protein
LVEAEADGMGMDVIGDLQYQIHAEKYRYSASSTDSGVSARDLLFRSGYSPSCAFLLQGILRWGLAAQ